MVVLKNLAHALELAMTLTQSRSKRKSCDEGVRCFMESDVSNRDGGTVTERKLADPAENAIFKLNLPVFIWLN